MNSWTRTFLVVAVVGLVALLMWKVAKSPRDTASSSSSPSAGARASGSAPENGASPTGQPGEVAPARADAVVQGREGAGAKTTSSIRTGKGMIFGSVRAMGSDRHVAGAIVTLDLAQEAMTGDAPDDHPRWQTTTNDAGEFEFQQLPEGGYVALAAKDQMVGLGMADVYDGGNAPPVQLVLQPAQTIQGRVVNESGQGIAKAEVFAAPASPAESGRFSEYSNGALAGPMSAITDAEGNFALRQLPGARWRLSAKAEGYAVHESDPVTAGGPDLEMTLTRGATARCAARLADSGAAVPGIVVLAEGALPGNRQKKTTDDAGQVMFDGLADDDYTVSVRDAKYVVTGQEVHFSVKSEVPVEGVQLAVAVGGVVTGHIYEAGTREPVRGAEVVIYGAGTVRSDRSGADGAYRLEGVASGAQCASLRETVGYMRSETVGYMRSEQDVRSVAVRLGEESPNVDFLLKRGVTVRGRVVDTQKKPIARAQVTTENRAARAYDEFMTVTGDDGAFEAPGIAPNARLEIRAVKTGYAQLAMEPTLVGANDLNDVVITLGPGGSISGVVNDTSGKPVPQVSVWSERQETSDARNSPYGQSAEDGRFTIAGLREGVYLLHVNGAQEARESTPPVKVGPGQNVTGVTLVYESTRQAGALSISGRVTNSKGDGVARANVYASMRASQGERATNSYGSAMTGKDGRYTITGLWEGEHEVSVHSQHYAAQKPAQVTAGSTNANFVLQDFGAIEGQVLDAVTGRPITNFEIGLGTSGEGEGVPESGFGPDTDRTPYSNAEGKFRVERVEPGDVMVRAYAPGHAPGSQVVRGVRSGETASNVKIRLSAGGIVEGHVRSSAGEPIPGVQIVAATDLDEPSEGMPGMATTDTEGAFRLDSLSLETVQILAHHADYVDAKVTVTPKAGAVTPVEITLGHGGVVTGVVRKNGKPAAGLEVNASGDDVDECYTTTNPDGTYTLQNVPPGEIQVEVSLESTGASGATRLTKATHVTADRSTVVDFDFTGGSATVEGKITSGGQPVRHARVMALPTELGSGATLTVDAEAETGEDGSYKIEGAPVGKIRLLVALDRDTANDTENSTLPTTETRVFTAQTTSGQTTRRDIDIAGGSAAVGSVTGLAEGERGFVMALRGEQAIPENELLSAMYGERRSGAAGSALTKPDGAFRISNLEPGRCTIMVVAVNPSSGNSESGPRYTSATITVPESGEVRVDLRIPRREGARASRGSWGRVGDAACSDFLGQVL